MHPATLRWAAALIALGGMCLGVKAVVILLTGDQPPVLFEVAGLPLGLGLLLLARWCTARHGEGRLLKAAAVLSLAAALAAVVFAITDALNITGPLEPLLAVCSGLGPMVAALLIGLSLRSLEGTDRSIGRRALLVAIVFVPAMIVGGVAADLAGERLFELGLIVVSAAWLSLAQKMWTTDDVSVHVPH